MFTVALFVRAKTVEEKSIIKEILCRLWCSHAIVYSRTVQKNA